ncbi:MULTISPECIES: signal peptidase I [Salinivibrio]|jgi:signal peptidase I (EC:3.4.21.89). Serine peptidase. MEROPS family S26A|uniref:Signal peptidase I n=1 Tax=Salinivibrio kushneri TaxID=1908198 RepID=A0AB36K6H3_9GAMM|nr:MULTISPECIES: signal peptidase I [Salinivibrio]ODP95742.1 signal peptidase I [Salinivibrio sp. BNH]OOE35288.1 S26 family signal peptidase [Salinivibrio kushneri]OOE43284.1 S26 family signal peptidase [Salinivibrio kushneri]OOE47118.1 S26 family signal peptidase [Salinivibrio kushneri]OOE50970.1 S26 family signal peptidase [Salinivibrio kushneri]
MANTFSLILVLVTLVTGIVWALDKYRWAPRRRQTAGETLKVSARELDAEQVAKVAPQPSWVENMASIFPVIAVVLVLRSFIYEPFQIPSGSMMPTLLVGDFILVEKFAYGLRDPAFHTEIVETGKPERGDIVVFKYPPQPNIDYIKRAVGLPGDTVVYEDKRLCIQPKGESQCQPVPIDDIQPSAFVQAGINLVQAQEQLGEQSHQILVHPKKRDRVSAYQPRPGVNRWVVPEGHYFMMGDNRDNSADSRFWGFVPERNLVGKAVAIWVSFEFERSSDSWLPSWVPTGIRFNRIGGID